MEIFETVLKYLHSMLPMYNTIALLCLAAFSSGLVDSIAGGGGMIQLPAIMLTGIPTQVALGTNKFVSSLGTTCALMNFARKGLVLWKPAIIGVPFTLIGSIIGSRYIISVDSAMAAKIVLALLPFAALIMLIPHKAVPSRESFTALTLYLFTPLVAFCIGFYDGIFGPGTGTFYIIAFHFVLRMTLVPASATAKVFNLTSNIGAVAVFLWHDQVLFYYAIPMAVMNILGGIIGSQMAIHIGQKIVQKFVILSIVILFSTLLYQHFLTT